MPDDGHSDSTDQRGLVPGSTVVEPGRQGLTIAPEAIGTETVAQRRAVARGGLTADGRFRVGRLSGLSMNGAIWVLSWPVLVESFLNSLVGLTDTTLSAGLPDGESAADAVGAATYMMWFIGLVFMAVGVGATALVSRSVGRGRLAVAGVVVGQTITLGAISGAVVGLLVAVMLPLVIRLLNLSDAAAEGFTTYMITIAIGAPVASVMFGLIACARGAGDSVRPLQAMLARNAVNIVVSWLLSGAAIGGVVSPLGLDWGIGGIAVGTVLGDTVGMIVVLRHARSGVWGVRLLGHRMRPHWHTLRRMIRLGLPNFAEMLGMWVGNFFVIMMVGWLAVGAAAKGMLGAHVIAIRIEAFSFLPGFAMGAAAATLAGQYLGANAPALARAAIARCTLITVVMMGVSGTALALAPLPITRLLTTQPVHLEWVPKLLIICGIVQVPFGISIVLRSAMRGAGDVTWVAYLTWLTTYGFRLPMAYAGSGVDIPLPEWLGGGMIENPIDLSGVTGGGWLGGLTGLWIGLCAELVVRGIVFTARFLQGGWARIRV
jgi:putative MATE family efflux protein